MALTVRELIKTNQKYFQLQLLAGESGMDYDCTWVHLIEDARIADFFWGNEMVITSGYLLKDEHQFLTTVKMLLAKRCAGIVVNIGPYIQSVPQSVIDFCEENQLPLLTMPWVMSMTEFLQDCCTQIVRSIVGEEQVARAVMEVIRSKENYAHNEEMIQSFFDINAGFTILAIEVLSNDTGRKALEHRGVLRVHTALRDAEYPVLVFWQEHHLIVILNQTDKNRSRHAADAISLAIRQSFPRARIHVGIGDPITDAEKIGFAYSSATAARRHAELSMQEKAEFAQMGFYKIFYTVSDSSVLSHYYEDVMKPLLDYESVNKKDGVYSETLFRYILSDGSLKQTAKAMFVHENTAYYRMNKIREILDNNLETLEQRQPFLMAYFCGVILNIIPEIK